jgi:HD-like signal output (HDOD) protein
MSNSPTPDTLQPCSREAFAQDMQSVRLPVLPAAVSSLLVEVNSAEPDVRKLETIISAEPQISAKVLRTVNSSQFALRAEVRTIRHAIALLGFDRIRSIVLSFTLLDNLPVPATALFQHEAFWTDTLLRAQLARALSRLSGVGDPEEAFTAMMLADISVPILLTVWEERYGSLLTHWSGQPKELAQLEREEIGWDHAQASAWILNRWEFPELLVKAAGSHNLDYEALRKEGLAETIALPVIIASLLPSSLKPDETRCRNLMRTAHRHLNIRRTAWTDIHDELRAGFLAVANEFELGGHLALAILDTLKSEADK